MSSIIYVRQYFCKVVDLLVDGFESSRRKFKDASINTLIESFKPWLFKSIKITTIFKLFIYIEFMLSSCL